MLTKAYFTRLPEAVKYMSLPTGEADVWLRKNIAERADGETGAPIYEADEAYIRTSATETKITADFESWFAEAAAWEPSVPEKEPETQSQRIAALEVEVDDLKAKNAALEEQLQAAKIVLGVE